MRGVYNGETVGQAGAPSRAVRRGTLEAGAGAGKDLKMRKVYFGLVAAAAISGLAYVLYAAATPAQTPATSSAVAAATPARTPATSSAVASPVAATPAPAAPSSSAPSSGKATSTDLFKKAAEVYKAAKIYYEESDFDLVVIAGAERQEEKFHIAAGFRRPSTVKILLSEGVNDTLFYDNGQLTALDRDQNQYAKQTVGLDDLARGLQNQFPVIGAAISDDPCGSLTQGMTGQEAVKETEFGGRPVYQVDFEPEPGTNISYFLDKAKSYLVGVKADITAPDGESVQKTLVSVTVNKILIDELPKDASGKAVDFFAFALPSGAAEVKQPAEVEQPGALQPPAPSSDSAGTAPQK